MASQTLNSIAGGSSTLPQLAPDLTWPSRIFGSTGYEQTANIDASGGLTTVLNLSGKNVIYFLEFANLTAENITIKATKDGVPIWDATFVCSTTLRLFGSTSNTNGVAECMECDESFVLEIQTTTDNDIIFNRKVRPIL